MKESPKTEFRFAKHYDKEIIDRLKQEGYQYFNIKGYTADNRPTYIEPSYILLTPIKALSKNGRDSEIYESIDSLLISTWVNSSTKIFVVIG